MKSYILKEALLKDPSTSYFLKGALDVCDKRDPLDAVYDAEVLLRFCQLKNQEALHPPLGKVDP